MRLLARRAFATASIASEDVFIKAEKLRRAKAPDGLYIHCNTEMVGIVGREPLTGKLWRYADVTGFLTRWFNRREWILDLDSCSRVTTPMITEYERKVMAFMGLNMYLAFGVCAYTWINAVDHLYNKGPVAGSPDYQGQNLRKKDFGWHGHFWGLNPKLRCNNCRWLDFECKKECFQEIKDSGHTLIINNGQPLSKPRSEIQHH